MDPTATRDTLKIGDLITLKSTSHNSYLSAEGILLDDVNASTNLLGFDDNVFCVHLQRQYSAARELDAFLTTYSVDINNVEDSNTAKYLHALQVSLYLFKQKKYIFNYTNHACLYIYIIIYMYIYIYIYIYINIYRSEDEIMRIN